ncbi:hypothetical protein NL676_035964 [Syzygium grande]|nr:hypothetical protein NL676_035964 [Syzygium grande]
MSLPTNYFGRWKLSLFGCRRLPFAIEVVDLTRQRSARSYLITAMLRHDLHPQAIDLVMAATPSGEFPPSAFVAANQIWPTRSGAIVRAGRRSHTNLADDAAGA